jgi:hypothetical protein
MITEQAARHSQGQGITGFSDTIEGKQCCYQWLGDQE